MPAGEFRRHFLFWQRFKWGMQDDLLAENVSQSIAARLNSKPIEGWRVKDYTLTTGSPRITRITPASVIRGSFNAAKSMFAMLSGRNKNVK